MTERKLSLSSSLLDIHENFNHLQHINNFHAKTTKAARSPTLRGVLSTTNVPSKFFSLHRVSVDSGSVSPDKSTIISESFKSPKKAWPSVIHTTTDETPAKKSFSKDETHPVDNLIPMNMKRKQTVKSFLVHDELKNSAREDKLKYHSVFIDKNTKINAVELLKGTRKTVATGLERKIRGTMFSSELWDKNFYNKTIKRSGINDIVQRIKNSRYQNCELAKSSHEQTYRQTYERRIEAENLEYSKFCSTINSQTSFDQDSSVNTAQGALRLNTAMPSRSFYASKSRFFSNDRGAGERCNTVLLLDDNAIYEPEDVLNSQLKTSILSKSKSDKHMLNETLTEGNERSVYLLKKVSKQFKSSRDVRKASLEPLNNTSVNLDNASEVSSVVLTTPEQKLERFFNNEDMVQGGTPVNKMNQKLKILLSECKNISKSTIVLHRDVVQIENVVSQMSTNPEVRNSTKKAKISKRLRSSSLKDCLLAFKKI